MALFYFNLVCQDIQEGVLHFGLPNFTASPQHDEDPPIQTGSYTA